MGNPFTFKVVENLGVPLDNYRRVKRLVKDLKDGKAYTKIGVVGDKAGQREEGGLTNAQLAMYQEFGTENIPARSFINKPFANNKGKYLRALAELLPKVLEGTMPVSKALNLVGLAGEKDMRDAIRDGIPPPLAPATIAAKGSSKPLIDTGQLLRSISHLVVLPGSKEE